MTTKEQILASGLKLFNDRGTAAVSTNHIAADCGISPGNLYYHFKNKEAIIRGIFEDLFALWDSGFALPTGRQPELADIQSFFRHNFRLMWDHRFIYRELPALLRRDTELRLRYVAVRQRGYEGFHELAGQFKASGILSGRTSPEAVRTLTDLCWLISEFWLGSLEVSGRAIDQDSMQDGVELMMRTIEPYLAGSHA